MRNSSKAITAKLYIEREVKIQQINPLYVLEEKWSALKNAINYLISEFLYNKC